MSGRGSDEDKYWDYRRKTRTPAEKEADRHFLASLRNFLDLPPLQEGKNLGTKRPRKR